MPGRARARGFAVFMTKKYGKRDAIRRVKLRAAAPESKSEKRFWPLVLKEIRKLL